MLQAQYSILQSIKDIENILETYDLEEIFELNDLTEADVLYFLVTEQFIHLPDPLPVDYDKD